MASDIAWEWYRSFWEVAQQGSLSAAARALSLTQPTLGRHIASLEAQLSQRLFVRSASGLQLTEQGRSLLPYAQSMATTAAALQRAATAQTQAVMGTVRISASEIFATEVLPGILLPVTQTHAGLALEIVATDKLDDLLHRESDIAVRMLRPTQEALIAKHIGCVELGLYAHQHYLRRQGLPCSLQQLLAAPHRLIGFDQLSPFARQLIQRWPQLQRSAFTFRTDSAASSMALLRAGAGIGLCQAPLARREPALQRLLPEVVSVQLDVWLAMHEDLRAQPACQAVFNALAQGLGSYLGG